MTLFGLNAMVFLVVALIIFISACRTVLFCWVVDKRLSNKKGTDLHLNRTFSLILILLEIAEYIAYCLVFTKTITLTNAYKEFPVPIFLGGIRPVVGLNESTVNTGAVLLAAGILVWFVFGGLLLFFVGFRKHKSLFTVGEKLKTSLLLLLICLPIYLILQTCILISDLITVIQEKGL